MLQSYSKHTFLMHVPDLKAKYFHLNQFYMSIIVSNNRIYLGNIDLKQCICSESESITFDA